MALVFATIPVMLFAVAIAVIPGIVAMRLDRLEERRAARRAPLELHVAPAEPERRAA